MEPVQCPKCQITMREREKGDVIVDICPQCRGIWLDAGELEKLSVRESRYYDDDDDDGWDDRRPGDDRRRDYGSERGRDYDRGRVQSYPQHQRKKRGFLQSMMESFGEGGGDD